MSQMDPLLLAELQRRAARVNFGLELDHPRAGTIRMSVEGFHSKARGTYRPLLASIGAPSFALSGWTGGLTGPTGSADIRDVDGSWTLTYGRELRGCALRGLLVGLDLPSSAYYTWFTCVVDRVSKSNAETLNVGFRMNDDVLKAKVARSRIAFPNLPATTDLTGKGIPYIIGNHDSSGLGKLGMVPLYFVGPFGSSPVTYRYLLASGWDLTVTRVFSGGVEKATPGDYVVVRGFDTHGRQVTLVEFTADQADAEVVADVQDLVSAAGPAACLHQLSANLIYNDYHLEDYALASAPLHAASVAACDVHLATLGFGRSYHVPVDRVAGADSFKEFGTSFEIYWHWRPDGLLAPNPWDLRAQNDSLYMGPGAPDPTLAQLQVLRSEDFIGPLTYEADPESAITRVSAKSGLRAADRSWLNQRSVVVSRGGALERVRDIELPWQPATGESVGNVEHLLPNGSSGATHIASFTGASIHATLAGNGPPPAAEDLNERVRTNTKAGIGTAATFDLTLTDMPDIVAVAGATIFIVAAASGAGADGADEDELTVHWLQSGTPYPTGMTPIVGIGFPHRYAIALAPVSPATGLPWTRTELSGLGLRVSWDPHAGAGGAVLSGKSVDIHQVWVEVNYTAAANVSPAALTVLSRLANRFRFPQRIYKVDAPLRFLDYAIGEDIPVVDPREGWTDTPAGRGRLRVIGSRPTPGKGSDVDRVGLTLEDVRLQQTTFWMLGRALAGLDGHSAVGDGMAMLTHGGKVAVTRASPKYLDSPAGIDVQNAGPVVRIFNNCMPSERRGTLPEPEATNQLTRSSFVSGGTGLTETPGSGSIDYDTTVGEQLFEDSEVTPQHLIITAGASHVSESRVEWPATAALSFDGFMVVSVDYKGSSLTANDGGAWRLVRDSDGFYWNDSTGAWQVGAVDNRLVESLTWERSESKAIPIGSGKLRTFTFSVSLPSGGTADRTWRVGHVQLEEGYWRSSRIVTDAAVETRAADVITVENDKDGYVTLPNKRGSWTWDFETLWSSANLPAGMQRYFKSLPYDANNGWSLYYEAGTGLVFKARAGGVDVTAIADVAIVAGTRYRAAVRWTSTYESPTETLTLLLSDGTTTTTVHSDPYTTPTFAAGKLVAIGCHETTANVQAAAYIVESRESPYCLKDEELAA